MGTKERREREREEVRARILDAARELFAREGYEAVSMRKIAEAIEYSPTAIYVHFADKADLMLQLCRNDFGSLAQVFRDLLKVGDPVERIRQCGHTYVRFAVTYPNHYRLMFMTPVGLMHDLERLKEMAAKDECKLNPEENSYALLLAAVVQGMEQGRFREELTDPELVAQTFWAAVHGVAAIEITHREDPFLKLRGVEDRAGVMVEGILRGMVREGAAGQTGAGRRGANTPHPGPVPQGERGRKAGGARAGEAARPKKGRAGGEVGR